MVVADIVWHNTMATAREEREPWMNELFWKP
jgi:hypothetical protein